MLCWHDDTAGSVVASHLQHYGLCGVILHVLPVSTSVSSGFSCFLRPHENMPVGGMVPLIFPLGVNMCSWCEPYVPYDGLVSHARCIPASHPVFWI